MRDTTATAPRRRRALPWARPSYDEPSEPTLDLPPTLREGRRRIRPPMLTLDHALYRPPVRLIVLGVLSAVSSGGRPGGPAAVPPESADLPWRGQVRIDFPPAGGGLVLALSGGVAEIRLDGYAVSARAVLAREPVLIARRRGNTCQLRRLGPTPRPLRPTDELWVEGHVLTYSRPWDSDYETGFDRSRAAVSDHGHQD